MGIATALETAPAMGRFFYLHRTIYNLGLPSSKPVAAGCGQLLICTCNPCFGKPWFALKELVEPDQAWVVCWLGLRPLAVVTAFLLRARLVRTMQKPASRIECNNAAEKRTDRVAPLE